MDSSHVQNTMQVPEELLALFSRNLTFGTERPAGQPLARETTTTQPQQQQQPASAQPQSPQPSYSASQHYTHSYHVVKPRRQDTGSTTAAQNQVSPQGGDDEASILAEAILRSYGVEARLLTPSQLQLFRTADDPQKLRLVELWSICPPDGAQNIPALAWSSTSLEQEEHLAHVRYQREQQNLLHEQEQQEAAAAATQSSSMDCEPYMTSGYQQLRDTYCHFNATSAAANNATSAYNKALDPIYLGPDFVREQQMDMASQYGAFEQMRADAMDVM